MKRTLDKADRNGLRTSKTGVGNPTAGYFRTVQKQIANYLQVKTIELSKREKKISLLLFSLLFGGCSVAVLLYSFLTIGNPPQTQSITFPKYAVKQSPRSAVKDSLITLKEYARIQQFRHYLEQLQKDKAGKQIYDSLLLARPYLLDSIRQVDSIFLHQ